MADGQLDGVLQHIRRLLGGGQAKGRADRALLDAFLSQRDEEAFAELVRRHGAMVLGVCRRILGNLEDAEDSCQAVFLLLARKAATVRKRHALGSWLHGAAFRVASNLKRERARRRAREQPASEVVQADVASEVTWREVKVALDDECARLPERYRTAVVLCYLEGHTREEAAQQLGCSLSTLHGRLERGRELLRAGLTRRGLTLSAALFGTFLAEEGSAGTLSAALMLKISKAAALFVSGQSISALMSSRVIVLAEGALTAMRLSQLKVVAVTVVTAGMLGLGAGVAAKRLQPAAPAPAEQVKPNKPVAADVVRKLPAPVWQEHVTLHGHTGYVSMVFSADGKTLATAGWYDGVVRFWDTAAWRELGPGARVPLREGDIVRKVAFAADRRTALALVENSAPNLQHVPASALVEIASGKVLTTIPGNDPIVSPDGKTLATANPGAVRLWDAATGKEQRSLPAEADWRRPTLFGRRTGRGSGDFLAFSPDGKLLATSKQGGVQMWQIATGKALALPGYLPRFSPDGMLLATAELDRTIKLWDVATGKERAVLRGHTLPYLYHEFSPDGTLLLTVGDYYGYAAGVDPNVLPKEAERKRPVETKLWDVATAQERLTLPGQTGFARLDQAFFSPDGRTLAYNRAFPDGGSFMTIWDVDANKVRFQLSQGDTAQFSPDGKMVATARFRPGGELMIVDVATGERKAALSHGPTNFALYPSFSPDGKLLASLSDPARERNPEVKIWQLTDLPLVKETRGTPQTKKPAESKPLSPAQELEALRSEPLQASTAKAADVAHRALELARKHDREPIAFEALAFAINLTLIGEESVPLKAAAIDQLLKDHLQREQLGQVLERVNFFPHPSAEKLLRTALNKSPHREVRGLACYRLAESFSFQSEMARQVQQLPALVQQLRPYVGNYYLKQFQASDPGRLGRESETLFERVRKEFTDVRLEKATLGEAAGRELLARRRFAIGKPAPEIDAEDVFGQKMKLSDYRGKVVVLDFTSVRGFLSHKPLVKRLEDKPFVLLGVLQRTDAKDRDDLKNLLQAERVAWRAWSDSDNAMARRWDARSFTMGPACFVLDVRGIIRFRGIEGPALDQAVDILLKELADPARNQPQK